MADNFFRVMLDVTDLYLENFKYVWINVSPRELKTISDLKEYIFHKIKLEHDIQLFVRDGLLLEEETIVVLRENDTVKIKSKAPVSQNLVKESLKKSANSSRKRNLSESNVNEEDINLKRYKPEVVTLSSNGNEYFAEKKSKKEKKKKQSELPINSESIYNAAVEKSKNQKELPLNSEHFCSISVEKEKRQTEAAVIFENCHSNVLKESQKKSLKKNKKKSSVVCDQTVTDINFCITDSFYSFNADSTPQIQNNKSSQSVLLKSDKVPVLFFSNNSSKKGLDFCQNESFKEITDINSEELNKKNQSKTKRKRRRKRKTLTTDVTHCSDILDISEFSENVDKNITRKHVVYLSPDKNHENNCLNHSSEFLNPSTETFVLKEDKFANVRALEYPKMSTPTQSNNCDAPDWQLSIMPNKNSSLVKYAESNENSSILHGESTSSTASQSNRKNKSQKQLHRDLPDITSLPVVGTCIAYKALELDENYSPKVTDYREGVVERINPDTEEIEIQLFKEIILPGRSGKFENLGVDEVPEAIIKSHDVLKWCDIISPKLLNCVPD